jgi:hypothetical protein
MEGGSNHARDHQNIDERVVHLTHDAHQQARPGNGRQGVGSEPGESFGRLDVGQAAV